VARYLAQTPHNQIQEPPGSGPSQIAVLLSLSASQELVFVHFVARPRTLACIRSASTSILILIELLLLFGREQRTDLRRSAGDDRLDFLHGLPTDVRDLWLGLID